MSPNALPPSSTYTCQVLPTSATLTAQCKMSVPAPVIHFYPPHLLLNQIWEQAYKGQF